MRFVLIISLLFLMSCLPDFEAKRIYLKEIRNADIHIEWFYYSLIGNTTPKYVIVTNIKDNVCDTICWVDRIEEVVLKKDTIFLYFDGNPTRFFKNVDIQSAAYNYTIQTIIDSTIIVAPKMTYMK